MFILPCGQEELINLPTTKSAIRMDPSTLLDEESMAKFASWFTIKPDNNHGFPPLITDNKTERRTNSVKYLDGSLGFLYEGACIRKNCPHSEVDETYFENCPQHL